MKHHLADLRARSALATEQLIHTGRAAGWLVVPREVAPVVHLRLTISSRLVGCDHMRQSRDVVVARGSVRGAWCPR